MTGTNTQEPVYQTDALIAEDIDKYLEVHQHKTMLRFRMLKGNPYLSEDSAQSPE